MKISHNRNLYTFLPKALCIIPIIAIFLLTFSVNAHAEGSIYFPMRQNQNNIYTERDITQIEHFLSPSSNFYFCWVKSISAGNHQYYYVKWPKSANAGLIATTSGYQFNLSYYGSTTFTYGYLDIKTQSNYHGNYESYVGNNPTSYIQGNKTSSVYSNTVSYLSNISIYDSTNVDTRHVVLIYGTYIEVPTQGHAVSPTGSTPAFNYPIGMHPTAAPTVPSYTPPTINTAPVIDTTNINTLVQSVFDLLSWGIVSIVQYFITLINVILDWFDFLGNLLLYIVSYIIDLYNAFVDWMYRLYTALFEPIYNFFNAFFSFLFNENDQKSVYDLLKEIKTVISNGFTNLWSDSFITNFWSNLTNTYSYFQILFAKVLLFFDKIILLGTVNGEFTVLNLVKALFVPSGSEVVAMMKANDEYGFYDCGHALYSTGDEIIGDITRITPIKTFHVPGATWHGKTIGDFNLSFDWYDDYKSYGDGIISVFLIFGWVYWLWLNLSHLMRGSASVGPDIERVNK